MRSSVVSMLLLCISISAHMGSCSTPLAPSALHPLFAASDDGELDKPAIHPPFSEEIQDRHLRQDFPSKPWRHERWPKGWLPKSCIDEAEYNRFDPLDFDAVDVKFVDCPLAWTVCRHKDSDEPWISVLDTLSAVPVGMRQYISNLVLLPGNAAPVPAGSGETTENLIAAAYTRGAVLVFTPSYFKLGVLFHEITHILDSATLRPFLLAHAYPPATPFSHTKFWKQAYGNDSAVPTPYSKASWQEDFADAGRWAMSHYSRKRGLAEYSRGWRGCRTQIAAFQAWMGDIIFTRDGKCSGKVAGSKAVRVPGRFAKGSRPPGRVPGYGSGGDFERPGSKGGGGKGGHGAGSGSGSSYRPEGSVSAFSSGVKEIILPEGVENMMFVYRGPVPDWDD
ncbi:hypothetical protein QBC43DRAFT_292709 [Cladorrhinum sp. PSN259]|nr:hypothetical protein QBC43DRAFT_292709 [Cladorrhinum sp. PSN259]